MKISLIIPSRERISLLINCLNSFFSKAKNKANIEAIIIADDDDISFKDFNEYISYTKYNIKLFFVNRSKFCQRDYNNFGGRVSTGELIWVLNDDCIILTDNWDELIVNYVHSIFSTQKDKILYWY